MSQFVFKHKSNRFLFFYFDLYKPSLIKHNPFAADDQLCLLTRRIKMKDQLSINPTSVITFEEIECVAASADMLCNTLGCA